MENTKVGFVGCGMMGSALIKAIAKAIPEKISLFATLIL